MRRTLLLAALLGCSTVTMAGPAADLLHRCAEQKGEDDDIQGPAALEAACPGVGAALDELGARALLSKASLEHLDPSQLDDVVRLTTPVEQRPPPALAPLRGILDSIRVPAEKRSIWDRFMDWVRRTLGRGAERENDSWLLRLLDSLNFSEQAWHRILNGLIGLVLLAAGWILYTELKAAGLISLSLGRTTPGRQASGDDPAREDAPASLAELPPAERIGALYRLVLSALAERRRMAIRRSQTHRQLRERLELGDEAANRRFLALASVAEEQLYAGAPVAAERLEGALAEGQALYASVAAGRTR